MSPTDGIDGDYLPLMNSADFDAEAFESEYLVKGVLAAGQPAIVAGPSKSLKSTICVNLAISLASGTPFLSEPAFAIQKPRKIALINGESGMATIRQTARAICASKGLRLGELDLVSWGSVLPRLGDPGSETRLRRTIEKLGVEGCIVDPAYQTMADLGDDARNMFKVGKMLRVLSEIAADTGCVPILVHHLKKTVEAGRPPELGGIAWAGFGEWARQWLLTGRRVPFDPSRPGQHKLWMTTGGSAGHVGSYGVDVDEGGIGRPWSANVIDHEAALKSCRRRAAAKTRQTAQEQRERLMAVLAAIPEGDTPTALAKASKLNSENFKAAIEWLQEHGHAAECHVRKGAKEHKGYRLAP